MTRSHRLLRLLGSLALGLILVALLPTQPAAASPTVQRATVLLTGQILRYTQLEGNPNWVSSSYARFQGASWTFYPDGTFVFMPANSDPALYPLVGSYSNDGRTISVYAARSVRPNANSSSEASIQGSFSTRNGKLTGTSIWYASTTSVAVINGQHFAQTRTSAYEIVSTLVRPR
jgi:hypothetical protein